MTKIPWNNIVYYKTINKALGRKLKRSFTNSKHSWMYNQLKDNRTISGAAVAFSKAGYIIGWSSAQIDSIDNTMLISTFVSKRYRHKGLAAILIKRCVEENKGTIPHIANRSSSWVGIDSKSISSDEIKKMIDG